jgi:hypothetical protein
MAGIGFASIGSIGGSIGNPMGRMMASSGPMRDLRRWIPIGLAAAVVSVAAIGYGFIASGVAAPVGGSLGTLAVADVVGAAPVYLADGRPAFVVRTAEAVHVIDARPPVETGTPSALVAWCPGDQFFFDWVNGGSYGADGGLLGSGVSGLIVYPTTLNADASEVAVGGRGSPSGPADGDLSYGCDSDEAVLHEPVPEEVFDPSVAADEEPPGWIWLEGRLEATGGQALLCDDPAATDCATGAVVRGIDPAKVAELPEPMAGYFMGRIGDGVVDELHYVPHSVRGS